MNVILRARDSGLQSERTALSWHRTAFSSLILALLTTRSGFSHDELLLTISGGVATLLSLALVIISFYRQGWIACDAELTSLASLWTKYLICLSLGINALAISLHSAMNLLN